jgi:thiol-disulfide isomerase/thioredoxin
MKKIFLAFITLTMVCACNNQVCKINGTITDPVDSVQLVKMTDGVVDVAAVKDGKFTLQCPIDPEFTVSILRGDDYDPIILVPDSKKITVSMEGNIPVVSGSPLSEEFQALQQWCMSTFFENMSKALALEEAGDTAGAQALNAGTMKQIADHCREVYLLHKDDAIAPQAMTFLIDQIDKDEFIELYEQGGKAVKADAHIGGYYEHLKSLPEEAVITLLDNGEIIQEKGAFEDYVGQGKYTLVDFWASWCGPCRAEAPNVVAVFEKYRDKGLVVIGVPVNDMVDATKKAMQDLGIHYPQVLDPSMRLAEQFGIVGIPHIILFDPEGNIIAKGLREAQIEAAVSQVLP